MLLQTTTYKNKQVLPHQQDSIILLTEIMHFVINKNDGYVVICERVRSFWHRKVQILQVGHCSIYVYRMYHYILLKITINITSKVSNREGTENLIRWKIRHAICLKPS